MKKRPDPLAIPDGFLEKKMSDPSFRNPIEQIYDEKDTSNIILYNEKDEPIEFIQIAFIPYKKKDYVILRPVLPWEGLKEDEAIVFEIKKDGIDATRRTISSGSWKTATSSTRSSSFTTI